MKRCLSAVILLVASCGSELQIGEVGEVESDARRPVARIAGKRFTVFYQFAESSLDVYADPVHGLPFSPDHVHVFSFSLPHGRTASPEQADAVHAARSDFKYAPAFDLNDYPGWGTASDSQLALWAYAFRDEAIAAGADLFSFNEAPSTTGANAGLREKMIVLLRALAAPDARGVSLRGVLFLTEQAATPGKWTSSATPFWRAVNETCDAVVAEHFHGQGFVCQTSLSELADHLFAMREWLETSGNEDKQEIANQKFTVMHSTRYSPGPSGWAGADSDRVTLPAFQRNLSRAVLATRSRAGGFNRVAFGPLQDSLTAGGVHPRIALLARWHYAQGGGSAELACVANASVNCRCAE